MDGEFRLFVILKKNTHNGMYQNKVKSAYSVLVVKLEGTRLLRRPMHRRKRNIKLIL